MILFVLAILLAIVATIVFGIRKKDVSLPWISAAAAAAAALALIFSCVYQVGTKEEGILTSFGATSGHAGSGLHFKLPWEKAHEMDAAIQTDSYTGKSCLNVRIANQQTGCASISFQWRIKPNAGDELYKDYRSFEHVRDALVTRKLTAAVNEAFQHYNPLDAIVNGTGASVGANGNSNTTLSALAKQITGIMRREIGDRVDVLSTILPLISFDDATQGRINQLQQQVALTRIAEQKRVTNIAEAKANEALAKSVNASPNVLVARCLDTLDTMVKQHQAVPAGFTCWPGGTLAGVIANQPGGK
jgi:regulator of protease activity HflC (stomatin/prohibitin superfamily)